MSRYALEHYYEVTQNTKEDVSVCLMDLALCDNDFNGENGLEYLWEEAEGFESNAEYCLSIAEKEPTPREMVEKFISMWMGRDYYYENYDIGVLVRDDRLFISLAYTTEA
jgi:hypothetical protein